jgi:hypothetical protein
MGTQAFRDFTQFRKNVLKGYTAKFDVSLLEIYRPNYAWKAGETLTKQVFVRNVGELPAFVRLRWEEHLTIQELEFDYFTETIEEEDGAKTIVKPRFTVNPDDGAFIVCREEQISPKRQEETEEDFRARVLEKMQTLYGDVNPKCFEGHDVRLATDVVTDIKGWYLVSEMGDPYGQYGRFLPIDKHVKKDGTTQTYTVISNDPIKSDDTRTRESVDMDYNEPFVVTYEEWKIAGFPYYIKDGELNKDEGEPFWVIADGWAYWMGALQPNAQTEDLLSSITQRHSVGGKLTYKLEYYMEAVSLKQYANVWGTIDEDDKKEYIPAEIQELFVKLSKQ